MHRRDVGTLRCCRVVVVVVVVVVVDLVVAAAVLLLPLLSLLLSYVCTHQTLSPIVVTSSSIPNGARTSMAEACKKLNTLFLTSLGWKTFSYWPLAAGAQRPAGDHLGSFSDQNPYKTLQN